MRRRMMKSKIHRATVTDANLHYVGSITVDRDLMDLADLLEYEQVAVVDIDNGARLETYVIEGERGSGDDLPQRRRRPPGVARRPGDHHQLRRLRAARSSRATQPTVVHVDRANQPIDELTAELIAAEQPGPAPAPLRRGRLPARAVDSSGPTTPEPMADLDLLVAGLGRRRAVGRRAGRRAARHARSACSPRASSSRPPRAGPRAAWPRCSAATPTPPTSTWPTRWPPAPGCATSTRCGCSSTRARPASTSSSRSAPPSTATPTARSQLAREGGHSLPRVVHAGGAATGAEIERALVDAVRATAAAVHEGSFALDLLVEGGRCRGRGRGRRERRPAARCGPPTCSWPPAGPASCSPSPPTRPRPPATASPWPSGPGWPWPTSSSCSSTRPRCTTRPCRGRCCRRRCAATARCCATPRASGSSTSCCSRDKVSRAITAPMLEQGVDHLWLDATGLERFAERFPTIAAALRRGRPRPGHRLAARSPRPPTTAAAASWPTSTAPRRCPGCGWRARSACNGVHGANRLASNSLLDGMVFGPRVVEAIDRGVDGPERHRRHALGARAAATSAAAASTCRRPGAGGTVGRDELQRTMTAHAGVLRSRRVARAARRDGRRGGRVESTAATVPAGLRRAAATPAPPWAAVRSCRRPTPSARGGEPRRRTGRRARARSPRQPDARPPDPTS